VVLDMRMPGMNGLETMKAMRAMKPSLQVIILTGHASIDTAIEGVRLGACDFVTKPIAIDELVEKIQGAYRRAMLREEFGKSNK
jgi:DNA-binding NtrC family response regulator